MIWHVCGDENRGFDKETKIWALENHTSFITAFLQWEWAQIQYPHCSLWLAMCLVDLCPAIFEWCWVDLHLEFVVEFSQVTWHLACIIKIFSANSQSKVFNWMYFYRLKSKPVKVSLFSQLGEAQNRLSEFEWVYAESLNKWDILVSFYSGLLNNRFDDLCADGLPVLNKDMIDTLVLPCHHVFSLPSSLFYRYCIWMSDLSSHIH